MLDLLGDLLTGAVSTSDAPRKRWRWLLLVVLLVLGGAALAVYAWLETLEVTR